MNKRINRLFLIVLIFGLMAGLVQNEAFARPKFNEISTVGLGKMFADKVTQTMSNIGNWGFWVNYEGQTGHDPFTGSSGGYYPRGVMTAIYMDGIIWGAYLKDPNTGIAVSDTPRVGGIGYRIGTTPGWVEGEGESASSASADDPRVRIYRIRADWKTLTPAQVLQEASELYNVPLSGVTDAMTNAIIEQYKADWKEWPVDLGAPYYDVNEDGSYDPVYDEDGYPIPAVFDKEGNLIEGGDYPGIAQADQVVWLVVNDLNEAKVKAHSGTLPIGLELQITLWAYNQPNNTLGQIVFKRYKIINKSGMILDSMFVAQYSDPDIGDYSDDLVGCDTTLSLHFAYNGNVADAEYFKAGYPPAAAGFDFFQGPMVPSPGDTAVFNLKYVPDHKNLPMTSFGYFAAGGEISDPPMGVIDFTLQWYNMLNGYTPTNDLENPTPYIIGSGPLKGQPSKFPLYGDPVSDPNGESSDIDGKGENMGPGDRRMFAATGPFTMQPGDEQEIVVALIGGLGGDNLQSVADLKSTDVVAQIAYDSLFKVIPKPPAAPNVRYFIENDQVTLDWSFDSTRIAETEETKIINYTFEGYNVYQLPSPTAKLTDPGVKRIATFDVPNGVLTIKSAVFVPEYGTVVDLPIQFGTDSGIKRFFTVKKDYLTGKPLYRGSTYYFAVTAYSYDPSLVRDRALESTPIPIIVTIQDPKPGYEVPVKAGDGVAIEHEGLSDAQVSVDVVNPEALTGDDYEIYFTLQHWYRDTDGEWKRTNYPDSVGKMAKVADVSPSTMDVTGVYAATPGTIDLIFTLDLNSPDNDWVDGVKITFPSNIEINSWEPVSGAYGNYADLGQNVANREGTYIADEHAIMWGDSSRSTFGGIEGTAYFKVNVNLFTPPATFGYHVYDDGYGGNIVDAVGTLELTKISYEFKTERYWNVKNVTQDKVVIREEKNFYKSSDITAPVVDGLQFKVFGTYQAPEDFYSILLIKPTGYQTDIYGADLNNDGMEDIASYAWYGWAPTARAIDALGAGSQDINELIQDYEIRWTGVYEDTIIYVGADTIVFHKVKEGTGSVATLFGARLYNIADHPLNPNPGVKAPFTIRIPFEVWNKDTGEQINFLIYDRKQELPSGTDSVKVDMYPFNLYDRMYTYFVNTPYQETVLDLGDPNVLNHITWNLVWWNSSAFGYMDKLIISYMNPIQIGVDKYMFSTKDLVITYSKEKAKVDVEKINVFPNPYYAANALEPDRFNRFVTFNHLPQKVIVRIFTLGGVQVRKLEKNDESQFLQWDLKNEAGLPVASGLYIAYIDMPEIGKHKVLKLMIIQGEQVVEFY